VTEVRIGDQFGLLYLPLRVVVDQKLIEKHAASAGISNVRVVLQQLSGGGAANTALLSGSIDLALGGIPPLLQLWDKTRGTDSEVRAMLAVCHMPYLLYTNDVRVRKLEDYVGLTDHKIATISAKVSTQAITLQMAAARTWGIENAFKLDDMTVSIPHPQALAAVLSGNSPVKSHFATLPYSYTLERSGKAHRILSSYEMVGPHTGVVLYNTARWKRENPRLFAAVAAAFSEAFQLIRSNPRDAARAFVESTKSPLAIDEVTGIITDPAQVEYRPDIRVTEVYAQFLHRINTISNLPKSWKDYSWETVHGLAGS